jgi:hypothetical protein
VPRTSISTGLRDMPSTKTGCRASFSLRLLQPRQAEDSRPPLAVTPQSGATGRGAYLAEKRNSERVMRSKMDAAIRLAIQLSIGMTVHRKHRFMEVVACRIRENDQNHETCPSRASGLAGNLVIIRSAVEALMHPAIKAAAEHFLSTRSGAAPSEREMGQYLTQTFPSVRFEGEYLMKQLLYTTKNRKDEGDNLLAYLSEMKTTIKSLTFSEESNEMGILTSILLAPMATQKFVQRYAEFFYRWISRII